METLIIYDDTGYLLLQTQGEDRDPIGVPFMRVDIPEGKRLKVTDGIGVDTSVTPHKVILEDRPPTEIDQLRNDLDVAILELSMAIAMQGGSE